MGSGDDERTQVDVYRHDPADRLSNGTVVDGYVIDGVLGHGGMGIVYSATHEVIGKRTAIKVLRSEVSNNPATLDRFIQEARAVNAIGHPNIVDIFDFGTLLDGRAYLLMDLMQGESLRDRLKRGPLDLADSMLVLESVASALMAAHDKGFIHRDLKPDNVYLAAVPDAQPHVKLLDFGLAKLMPEAGASPFITKTGVMLGTPAYMSPEQARGESADYRTDVYSLGIVVYECLVGERPFPKTGDPYLALQYHAEEPAPSVGASLPHLPVELVQLVDAMLRKDPLARPSLAAVRTVTKRLRAGAALTPDPDDIPRTLRRLSMPPVAPEPDPAATTPAVPRALASVPPPAYDNAPTTLDLQTGPVVPRPPNAPTYDASNPSLRTSGLAASLTAQGSSPPGSGKIPLATLPGHPGSGGLSAGGPHKGTTLGVEPARAAVSQNLAASERPPARRSLSTMWIVIAFVVVGAAVGIVLALTM